MHYYKTFFLLSLTIFAQNKTSMYISNNYNSTVVKTWDTVDCVVSNMFVTFPDLSSLLV